MARKQKYIQDKQSKDELKVYKNTLKQKTMPIEIKFEEYNLKVN